MIRENAQQPIRYPPTWRSRVVPSHRLRSGQARCQLAVSSWLRSRTGLGHSSSEGMLAKGKFLNNLSL